MEFPTKASCYNLINEKLIFEIDIKNIEELLDLQNNREKYNTLILKSGIKLDLSNGVFWEIKDE